MMEATETAKKIARKYAPMLGLEAAAVLAIDIATVIKKESAMDDIKNESPLAAASFDAYNEAFRAKQKWPPFNSAHEGFAIMQEEVYELWDWIRTPQYRRDLQAMRKEAIQVAAMAMRFASECCDETVGRR